MKNRKIFKVSKMLLVAFMMLALIPVTVFAKETSQTALVEQEKSNENQQETDVEKTDEPVIKQEMLATQTAEAVMLDMENFPDEEFRNYLKKEFDTDKDEGLSTDEIAAIIKISIPNKNIVSLKGIEKFKNLEYLNCSNTKIIELDVSQNIALKDLYCTFSSELTKLNVSGAKALINIECSETNIEELDVSQNIALKYLICEGTETLQTINVNGAEALYSLDVSGTSLKDIDVTNNVGLIKLDCYDTKITTLDVTKNLALEDLFCGKTVITDLDISNNKNLLNLEFSDTKIGGLDISINNKLNLLDCDYTTPLAWLHIGEQTTEERYFPKPTIDIGTVESNFDIKKMFLGINPERMKIISGATMNAEGIVSEYINGTPIVYEYDCGNDNNESAILTVKLLFKTVVPKPDLDPIPPNDNENADKNEVNAPNTGDFTDFGLMLFMLTISGIWMVKCITQKANYQHKN